MLGLTIPRMPSTSANFCAVRCEGGRFLAVSPEMSMRRPSVHGSSSTAPDTATIDTQPSAVLTRRPVPVSTSCVVTTWSPF